jgi:hypothetical protein
MQFIAVATIPHPIRQWSRLGIPREGVSRPDAWIESFRFRCQLCPALKQPRLRHNRALASICAKVPAGLSRVSFLLTRKSRLQGSDDARSYVDPGSAVAFAPFSDGRPASAQTAVQIRPDLSRPKLGGQGRPSRGSWCHGTYVELSPEEAPRSIGRSAVKLP